MDKCCFDCKSFERTNFTEGVCTHQRCPLGFQSGVEFNNLEYLFENTDYTFVEEANYEELEVFLCKHLKVKDRNKFLSLIMEKVKEIIRGEVIVSHEYALLNTSRREEHNRIEESVAIKDGTEMVCKYFN